MKRNIIYGTFLIGALALGSCSTPKLASNQGNNDDDVYYSNARAGDAPEYVARQRAQDVYNNSDYADDYYYYGSYASRINRFGYISPFGYYNDLYYGYGPYGYNGIYSPFNAGFGLGWGGGWGGLGYGLGWGGYGYGLGWGGYGYGYGLGYSPYSFWGTGYGYGLGGGYPYWGNVTAYSNGGNARPYRAMYPSRGATGGGRAARNIGYNGSYPVNSSYPGRPVNNTYGGGRTATNGRGGGNPGYSRPTRPTNDNQGQNYQPPQRTYSPPPSSPPPSSSGGGGGGGRSGGGGGRPVRP